MKARNLALGFFVADQVLAAVFLAYAPSLVHSDRYVDAVQGSLGLGLAALVLAALYRKSKKEPAVLPGLVLVSAGLASNAVSWIVRGRFIDYVPTGLSYINAADVAVTVGCILLLKAVLTWR